MTRPADWRQREQARDPERSFIVQAPAGSATNVIQPRAELVATVSRGAVPEPAGPDLPVRLAPGDILVLTE